MRPQSTDKKVAVSLSIRGSILARAQVLAEHQDRSLSWLVDRIVEEWLESQPKTEADVAEE